MNLEALKELAARVEVGDFYHELTGDLDDLTNAQIETYFGSVFEQDHWAWQAYNGSTDAALTLCDALLPGWTVAEIKQNGVFWIVKLTSWDDENRKRYYAAAACDVLARAWLLAILRALIAQEEGK